MPDLKKKTISAESTRQNPCGELNFNVCVDVKGNAKVAEKLNCKVPFLNFGPHLSKFLSNYSTLPNCEITKTEEALDLFFNIMEQCKGVKACQNTIYSIQEKVFDNTEGNGLAGMNIEFSTFQVKHYTTYISYDVQSLIAEIGGLMGMTLGLAFSSIGDLMANLARRYLG